MIDTLERAEGVCPQLDDIFAMFDAICLTRVRVVIVGQNPYDTKAGQATGVPFAVHGCVPSATLQTLSAEIQRTMGYPLSDMTLSHWIAQGVFLMNSVFTTQLTSVRHDRVNHTLLWRSFVRALLLYIQQHTTDTVFVLLGSEAQALKSTLSRQTVITAPFPIQRKDAVDTGFIGSDVFLRCNKALSTPIHW